MKLSKEYIAGFIDGEAYLGIIRKTSTRCTLGYYYKPVIKIAQTEHAGLVLQLIKQKYGGNISKTRIPINANQRPSITLELTSGVRVNKVLEDVKNLLVVKLKQSEILRKFIKLPSMAKGKHSKDERLQIDAIKTKLYKEMLVLNKRGVAETE